MDIQYLKTYCSEKIKQYPQYKPDILDFYQLCRDEIEEGGSETHEVELCIKDIEALIKGETE